MSGSQKDDADHLAAYAENLIERAKEAVKLSNQKHLEWLASKSDALRLLMRARIAIREAQTQIR